jgi:hypothetical protein
MGKANALVRSLVVILVASMVFGCNQKAANNNAEITSKSA